MCKLCHERPSDGSGVFCAACWEAIGPYDQPIGEVEYTEKNAAYFEGRGKVLFGVVRNGDGEVRELSIDGTGVTRLDKRQVGRLVAWLRKVEQRMVEPKPEPKKKKGRKT
jgi:hypothetical protein